MNTLHEHVKQRKAREIVVPKEQMKLGEENTPNENDMGKLLLGLETHLHSLNGCVSRLAMLQVLRQVDHEHGEFNGIYQKEIDTRVSEVELNMSKVREYLNLYLAY